MSARLCNLFASPKRGLCFLPSPVGGWLSLLRFLFIAYSLLLLTDDPFARSLVQVRNQSDLIRLWPDDAVQPAACGYYFALSSTHYPCPFACDLSFVDPCPTFCAPS